MNDKPGKISASLMCANLLRLEDDVREQIGITPSYHVEKEWGPDHDKHFIIGVYIGGEKIAEGEGTSKQSAQRRAAEKGLSVKGWDEEKEEC
jgi:ribonuclease-3